VLLKEERSNAHGNLPTAPKEKLFREMDLLEGKAFSWGVLNHNISFGWAKGSTLKLISAKVVLRFQHARNRLNSVDQTVRVSIK